MNVLMLHYCFEVGVSLIYLARHVGVLGTQGGRLMMEMAMKLKCHLCDVKLTENAVRRPRRRQANAQAANPLSNADLTDRGYRDPKSGSAAIALASIKYGSKIKS